jgi:selenocysteine lyase/cysteine desulfurase
MADARTWDTDSHAAAAKAELPPAAFLTAPAEPAPLHLVHLDNANSSFPKPFAVRAALGSRPDSGALSAMTAGAVEAYVRRKLAQVLGAPDPGRIVLTDYATTALEAGVRWLLGSRGAHAVTTAAEHAAVFRALEAAGARVTVVRTDRAGRWDAEEVSAAFQPDTRLLVVGHASHVTGAIQPVAQAAAAAQKAGLAVLVDAAATVGAIPLSVERLGAEAVVFTGHKYLYGPIGAAGMWVRPGRDLPQLATGCAPERRTLVGLAAGLDFLIRSGLEAVTAHLQALAAAVARAAADLSHVQVQGPKRGEPRAPVVSLTVTGLAPQAVASLLHTRDGIICAAGDHCAPYLHRALGTSPAGTLRLAPGPFNTDEDVAYLAAALERLAVPEMAQAA